MVALSGTGGIIVATSTVFLWWWIKVKIGCFCKWIKLWPSHRIMTPPLDQIVTP